jgi:UDP-GlcNAc:undecaprenyl-phosphate GlcNAc-1-phosphate transferase
MLTPAMRSLANRVGAVDQPDQHRKLHAHPIPRLGGPAVLISFYAIAVFVIPYLSPETAEDVHLLVRSLPAVLLVLALGLADDLWTMRPSAKVAVELVAGFWVYYVVGVRIDILSNPFFGPASVIVGNLSLPATMLWIVLITNAFNIVDGMDGLAAGVAFIATCCMFLVSLQQGNAPLAAVAAPLAGALLGFLKYNFNPASIFLGDSGSLSIGFLLAILSVAGSQKSTTAISVAAPLFMLALPIVEVVTSTMRRFITGKPIWQADNRHIHHQMLRRGWSPKRAAILLYVGSALFGLGSLLIVQGNAETAAMTAVVLGLVAWLGIQQLGYSEFVEVGNAFKRGFFYQRRIIQNSILARRLSDDLRDAASLSEACTILAEVSHQLEFARVEIRLTAEATGHKPVTIVVRSDVIGAFEESDYRVIAVKLYALKKELGEVTLARTADAETLHSELALLVDALASSLPRLIGRGDTSIIAQQMRADESTAGIGPDYISLP